MIFDRIKEPKRRRIRKFAEVWRRRGGQKAPTIRTGDFVNGQLDRGLNINLQQGN